MIIVCKCLHGEEHIMWFSTYKVLFLYIIISSIHVISVILYYITMRNKHRKRYTKDCKNQ